MRSPLGLFLARRDTECDDYTVGTRRAWEEESTRAGEGSARGWTESGGASVVAGQYADGRPEQERSI